MEDLLASTLLDPLIGVLESLANRVRCDFSREFTPTTLNTRQGSCDAVTPNVMCTSHLTTSVSSQALTMKLQWQSRSGTSSIHSVKTKSSEESWQSRANFLGSAEAQWVNYR